MKKQKLTFILNRAETTFYNRAKFETLVAKTIRELKGKDAVVGSFDRNEVDFNAFIPSVL